MHSGWSLYPHHGRRDSDGAPDRNHIPGRTTTCQSCHRRGSDTGGPGRSPTSCWVSPRIKRHLKYPFMINETNIVIQCVIVSAGSRVSGCVDHFSLEEKEAFECTRNIISTLNFQLPDEEEATRRRVEEPLYSSEELLGLAPRSYDYSLDIKMVQECSITDRPVHWKVFIMRSSFTSIEKGRRLQTNQSLPRVLKTQQWDNTVTSEQFLFFLSLVQVIGRLTDGSRFQEFKARYGTTLITGFAKIHG